MEESGQPAVVPVGGYLVLKEPWPPMLRTLWGDDQRFKDTYWSRWPGMYFAGDGAKKDEDGDIWFLGRVDDVMNVSGHRLSTTEIESALVSHPKVAEAAVVGATDEMTGQAPCAFVILRESAGDGGEDIVAGLRNHVAKEIGAIAKPRQIMVVPELPKIRSGKIMRRLAGVGLDMPACCPILNGRRVQMNAGVDTHKDTLAVAVLNDRGQPVQVCQLPNTAKELAQLTTLLSSHHVDRVGIDGSGNYGRAVAAHLAAWSQAGGLEVVEMPPGLTFRERSGRPAAGKTDPADAVAIVGCVGRDLAGRQGGRWGGLPCSGPWRIRPRHRGPHRR